MLRGCPGVSADAGLIASDAAPRSETRSPHRRRPLSERPLDSRNTTDGTGYAATTAQPAGTTHSSNSSGRTPVSPRASRGRATRRSSTWGRAATSAARASARATPPRATRQRPRRVRRPRSTRATGHLPLNLPPPPSPPQSARRARRRGSTSCAAAKWRRRRALATHLCV